MRQSAVSFLSRHGLGEDESALSSLEHNDLVYVFVNMITYSHSCSHRQRWVELVILSEAKNLRHGYSLLPKSRFCRLRDASPFQVASLRMTQKVADDMDCGATENHIAYSKNVTVLMNCCT